MPARAISLAVLSLLLQTPQFKSGVDVVPFDVIVLDKARHPIAGLTAADFRVTEDGQPVRLAGFQAVTIPDAAAAASTGTAPAATLDPRVETVTNARDVPGRLVVIVLDHSIASEGPVATARKIADAAIDALGPHDLAAVVFTSGVSGNRPQGFTADRERLREAVASMQMGTPAAVEMTPNGLRHAGPNNVQGECYCGLCSMEKLALVADALASVENYRKMILFIGDDLPVSDDSAAGHVAACTGLFGDARDRLLETVERANITVHSFNPRGLETGALGADAFRTDVRESAAGRMMRAGNLQTLPGLTGGRTVDNTNQPERLVPAVFDESRTYYVLAIERGPARKDRRPHQVRFEVTRPDAAIVSRTTYLDPLPTTAKKETAADPLERALGELLPRNELPLRMTLAPGTAKNTVDMTLATPLSAAARADVLVGVFDEFAKQVGSERATVELPAAGGGDVEWKIHLNPKPGRYEIRAAVRIGHEIGTVFGHVEAGKAAVSGAAPARAASAPAPSTAARNSAALDALLALTGTYLEQYADPSNGLLLDEKYAQRTFDRLPKMRELSSALLILPDAAEGWVEFRDVLAVDGKPVVDRQDRLQHLFSGSELDPRALGRRITDEGARYNLNGATEVKRTLNHPMVPLLYLRAANQSRSQFAFGESAGRDGRHVSFSEIRTPALIGTSGDQTASGDFWIDPSTGRVTRAVLRVVSRSRSATVTATIRISYKNDPKIGRAVPVTMEEHYEVKDPRGGTVETVDANAWYRNPRQFKASAGGGR